ncbi:hypothetical protein H4R34_003361, partial [Dimargaris verticillata]
MRSHLVRLPLNATHIRPLAPPRIPQWIPFWQQATYATFQDGIHSRRTQYMKRIRYTLDDGSYFEDPIKRRILRPVLFTLAVGVSSFAIAAYYQQQREDASSWTILRRWFDVDAANRSSSSPGRPLGYGEMHDSADGNSLADRRRQYQDHVHYVHTRYAGVPRALREAYLGAAIRWIGASRQEKFVWSLMAVNAAIFGLWQVRRCQPWLMRHFTHHPFSGRSYTLLTSCFSHKEFTHLLFNMVALYSFAPAVMGIMPKETFPAFFLTAGAASGLLGHLSSMWFSRAALTLPSLGASGILYAVLSAFVCEYPHQKLSLIFLPFYGIEAQHLFPALIVFDTLGVIFKWRMMNHQVHLAGAAFGFLYQRWFLDFWSHYHGT